MPASKFWTWRDDGFFLSSCYVCLSTVLTALLLAIDGSSRTSTRQRMTEEG